MPTHRIGLVVPSSNVTVETELPLLLNRHAHARFSFHSSRMRMHRVSPDQLRAMNAQRERCVLEVGDAGVDAVLYACLVALTTGGPGEHARWTLTGLPWSCRTSVRWPSRSLATWRRKGSRSRTGGPWRWPITARSAASPATA